MQGRLDRLLAQICTRMQIQDECTVVSGGTKGVYTYFMGCLQLASYI